MVNRLKNVPLWKGVLHYFVVAMAVSALGIGGILLYGQKNQDTRTKKREDDSLVCLVINRDSYTKLETLDSNNDGIPEILRCEYDSDLVTYHVMDDPANYGGRINADSNAFFVIMDSDGDGRGDLVFIDKDGNGTLETMEEKTENEALELLGYEDLYKTDKASENIEYKDWNEIFESKRE